MALGSMGSLCLQSHISSSSINIPSTSQPIQDSQTHTQGNSRIKTLENDMSVMCNTPNYTLVVYYNSLV